MRKPVPARNRQFAKDMRNEPTKAESVLWQIVRGKRLEGLRFRRQHPIESFIVDFICLDEKLIIELDGSQHAESKYGMWVMIKPFITFATYPLCAVTNRFTLIYQIALPAHCRRCIM